MDRNILKLFYLLTFLFCESTCGRVIFEDCGSAYELDAVLIDGCSRTIPCHLTVGLPTNVTVYYKADFVSSSLTQQAYVVLNSIQKESHITPTPCEATWCPVKILEYVTYQAQLELPRNLALNTRGHLIWNIFNEKNVKVICFEVTIQTNPPIDYLLLNKIYSSISLLNSN